MRRSALPGAGRLPGCMHAAQLRWPQAGPVPVSCSLAPAPARRARTSPMAGSWLVGSGQREVCLDLVTVAAAVFLLHHVTGCGQVGDDAAGTASGDAQAGPRCRAAARSGRGRCTAAPGRGWPGNSSSPPLQNLSTVSRNLLLVFNCECRLWTDHRIRHRDQPPTAAKVPPGSPEGAAHGPHHCRARGAAHPAQAVAGGRELAGPGAPGPAPADLKRRHGERPHARRPRGRGPARSQDVRGWRA